MTLLTHLKFVGELFTPKNSASNLLSETIWLIINDEYGWAGKYNQLSHRLKTQKPELYKNLYDAVVAQMKISQWDDDFKLMKYIELIKTWKTSNLNWQMINQNNELDHYISENKLRNLANAIGNVYDALIATKKQ